jgi:ATP-binding cassette subfamily D (ALD) protein 4
MSPIAAVVYLQDKFEGNFRYKHMTIRSHAESVAFYNSDKYELFQTNKIFEDLLGKKKRTCISNGDLLGSSNQSK